MTEKEVQQQQEQNGQKVFYLIAVGMFYHAYGCEGQDPQVHP